MSTDRDTTRIVRSWLEAGVTTLPDRVLDDVLDRLPATPQRRSWWAAWRITNMNKLALTAAVAVGALVIAVLGYNLLRGPAVGGPGVTPSPSPAPLAVGIFTSHGVAGRIDATGADGDASGTLTVSDSGLDATVDLECSKAVGRLLIIGGLVTDSTFEDNFPEGRRVAVIFERSEPVKAIWWIALVGEPLVETCRELVDDIIQPGGLASGLEPIAGTVELGP